MKKYRFGDKKKKF
jgi:hypothetical protein